jgi:hypothetical protein
MAIIVVELDTSDAGDRRILDVVNNQVSAPDAIQTDTVVPLETVTTKKVKVNPPTQLKIVPETTGSPIADELKQELADIDAETEATASDVFKAPPPPAETGKAPPPPPDHQIPSTPPDLSAVETDADGLPWDRRIHASTKTKIVSGQWKAKRGVKPDTVSIVTEELRNVMGAVTTVAPAPPAIPLPAIDPNLPTTFETFVVAMVKAGKTNADVEPLLLKRDIKGINLLGARPDLIPEIWAELTT